MWRLWTSGRPLLETFGKPHFDEGLPGDAQAACFAVEPFHHPCRRIDAEPLRFETRTLGFRNLEMARDVLASVELCIEP